ncbi:MAG TPA: DUF3052 domain-containing protein [Thermoanaerobaculia bacterium]|nr:DUF3052 domain-containing protein [Thermoanaerobaculia bacterium]
MAGYSGTPLVAKLGLKPGARAVFTAIPEAVQRELIPVPEGMIRLKKIFAPVDFAIWFSTTTKEVEDAFRRVGPKLAPNGMIWIAWPKRASGVPTELTEDVIRRIGLSKRLVDVKVCAVDEVWSGLKFVIRTKDRPAREVGAPRRR